MSKIPTAEKLIFSILSDVKCENEIEYLKSDGGKDLLLDLINQVNNRTKLHVEAALKAASDKADTKETSDYQTNEYYSERIRNSYPLENIK